MTKLRECCLNITDGEHGSVTNDANGTCFLLSNKNIIDGKIVISDNDRRISTEAWRNINKRTKLESGDVLISTVGTLGKTAIVEGKVNYDFQRSVGIIKCNKDKLLNKFLYYYLNLPHVQNKLINTSKGAVQKCIFINDLKDFDVDIPDIEKQQQIIETLSTLDDKIEMNNKINRELEKTAKDLYNYWFVQFDFPDGNKRPYKSSDGKMVYNEILKREIPEDWTVDTLGSICNLYQPETISEKDCDPNGKYYVYGSNGIIGKYNKKNHDDSEIVISCRGDCGNIIRTMPNVWITGNAMVVRPKSNISQEFIYFALQNAGIKRIITGSVQGQITRKNLEPVKIVMPPIALLEQYEKQICGNVNIRIQNKIETEVLQQLRDFLLPMLMNGQVSVS